MKRIRWMVWILVVVCFIPSCAPLHERAFIQEGDYNSRFFEQSLPEVEKAALATLAQNSFLLEEVLLKEPRTVKAKKVIGSGGKTNTVSLCCYLFSKSEKTLIQVSADEEIADTYYRLKVFWLIFIPIPYGREPKREIVRKGNIDNPDFYKSFFSQIEKNLAK